MASNFVPESIVLNNNIAQNNDKKYTESLNNTPIPTQIPQNDSEDLIIEGKAAYWKYCVSDIGKDYIEVVNSNGTDKFKFIFDSLPKDIFYKGVVEKYEPLNNIIELSGERIDFSEICKGRIVDIVYKYKKSKTLCKKECVAINVYEEGYNNFSIKNIYWNCYVVAITNNQLMINNADGELVRNFRFDGPMFTCFLNATITEHPNRVIDISYGKSISYNSIRAGDLIDVLTDSSSGSDGDLDLWQGYSPSLESIYAINVHRE